MMRPVVRSIRSATLGVVSSSHQQKNQLLPYTLTGCYAIRGNVAAQSSSSSSSLPRGGATAQQPQEAQNISRRRNGDSYEGPKRMIRRPSTSMARAVVSNEPVFYRHVASKDNDGGAIKHCETCTCENHQHKDSSTQPQHQEEHTKALEVQVQQNKALEVLTENQDLPPPLPEPKYSVRRRLLPANLTALNSPRGYRCLVEALSGQTAAPYLALSEQFVNQSDPAYCGVSTLLMVLNTFAIDPQVRWKGGWRFYGNEDVLLSKCCLSAERVARIGITMNEFWRLGTCQGLQMAMKRPTDYTLQDFRNDIQETMTLHSHNHDNDSTQQFRQSKLRLLVVSFCRSTLGQTGEGHFSPIAAYHKETDQVLILDVARFKYQPYWVSVTDLFHAMQPLDAATQQPRGWYVIDPPRKSRSYLGLDILDEDLRPAHLVPLAGEPNLCPAHAIKVDFCQIRRAAKPNHHRHHHVEIIGSTENEEEAQPQSDSHDEQRFR